MHTCWPGPRTRVCCLAYLLNITDPGAVFVGVDAIVRKVRNVWNILARVWAHNNRGTECFFLDAIVKRQKETETWFVKLLQVTLRLATIISYQGQDPCSYKFIKGQTQREGSYWKYWNKTSYRRGKNWSLFLGIYFQAVVGLDTLITISVFCFLTCLIY